MTKRCYSVLLVAGCILVAIGILLPGEQIVRNFIPPRGEAHLVRLLSGMQYFKIALIANGILLLIFRQLEVFLWHDSSLPEKPLTPFFNRRPADRFDRSELFALVVILILAVVLRINGAGQSLYGDEIVVQQMYINRGLPVIFTYFAKVPQHVLYSIISWFSELLPLPIEISYRLPAIVFGTGSVALTYLLARQIFDHLAATVTGILSASAFFGIAYSHCAKGYTATHFLTLAAFLAIISISSDWSKPAGWRWLGISIGALGYLHLYNAYLCIAITICAVCVLLWTGGSLACLKRVLFILIITGSILFLLYSIQLPAILEQMASAATQPEEHLSLNVLHGWLAQLTFWGEFWPFALLCLFIACVGMISLSRREPRFTFVALGIPSVLLALVALNSSWIYPRYILFTLPFFLIFCIEGARSLGRTAGVIIFTIIFLYPTGTMLVRYYQVGHQNIRAASVLATGKTAYAYGLAKDMFPFYNPEIKRISSLNELQNIKGDFYLLYGYRKAWRGREDEFRFIDKHFTVVKRFDGMTMDLFVPDGEVVVARTSQFQIHITSE